jgi:hypothetical protein
VTIAAIEAAFNPDLAEHFEEAFERAGLDAADIGNRHINSLKRSTSYMLNSEWYTLGIRQWMVPRAQYTTVTGVASWKLPANGIDVFDAVLVRQGAATPINRMSRSDYLAIPNKTMTGRPDRFFVDRQYNQQVVTLWRTPEFSTDIIDYYYFAQVSRPGSLSNTLQMPSHVLEAFVSGLAARAAQKFNPSRFEMCWGLYCGGTIEPGKIGGALAAALEEDRERADVTLSIALNPFGGGRR